MIGIIQVSIHPQITVNTICRNIQVFILCQMGRTIKNNSLCKAIYLSSFINLTFGHITIVYNGEYSRFVAICHVVFQTILFHLEVRVLFLCLLPSSLYEVFFELFLLFEYNTILIKRTNTQQVITFIKHAICNVHRHLT